MKMCWKNKYSLILVKMKYCSAVSKPAFLYVMYDLRQNFVYLQLLFFPDI